MAARATGGTVWRRWITTSPKNMHFQYAFLIARKHFWWLQDFSEICIFPWENAYFLLFGWLQKMHISYFVDFVQKLRFSWNYAFLMAPRFFGNMHFSMWKCIFFAFRLAAETSISYFVGFCKKTKVFMELWWFQDFSEICIFSMGKCIFVCFSAGCRNAYSYFVDFVQQLRLSWNYAFLMAPRFSEICSFPCENAYCLLFGWLQKMHNSIFLEKSWSHPKCIIPWKPWFVDKINEYEICISAASRKAKKYAFSHGYIGVPAGQLVGDADRLPLVVRFPAGPRVSLKWWPAERQWAPAKKKHFHMENCIFLKILEPSKMHNFMKALVFGQNQRNMKYAFSAASRKAKKNAFSHGKKHISEKSWSHRKCILKMHIFCVLSKTHIENAYFLRAIFTAVQKCTMDLAGQLSWSARSPQKLSGGDLLTYVFLIFSMLTMMQRLSESKNCQGNITQTSQSLDWNKVVETRFPFFDLVLTRN